MFGRLLKASVALVAFNIFAGIFHYLYQVIAAGRLAQVDLGRLNVELTYYMLVVSLALVAQYFVVFRPPRPQIIHRLRWISVIVVGVGVLWFHSLLMGRVEFGARGIFFSIVPFMFLVHYWLGLFQWRQSFFVFGLGLFLFPLCKAGAAFVFALNTELFAIAVGMGALGTLIFLIGSELLVRSDQPPERKNRAWVDVSFSFFTAFGFVLFPSYDLLNIRHQLGEVQTGYFSQLQLFSRALYFAPVALLQLTLPYYVRWFGGQGSKTEIRSLRRLELGGFLACYLFSFVFAALGPALAERTLGIKGLESMDVLLACMAVTPLYGLMSSLQVAASAKRTKPCLLILASVCISPLGLWLLPIETIRNYLLYSLVINTAIGGYWLYRTHREMKKTGK